MSPEFLQSFLLEGEGARGGPESISPMFPSLLDIELCVRSLTFSGSLLCLHAGESDTSVRCSCSIHNYEVEHTGSYTHGQTYSTFLIFFLPFRI